MFAAILAPRRARSIYLCMFPCVGFGGAIGPVLTLLFGFAPFPHLIAAHDYMPIIVDAHDSSWAMSP